MAIQHLFSGHFKLQVIFGKIGMLFYVIYRSQDFPISFCGR